MKEIQLSSGKVALVDDDDFEIINRHKWSYAGGYAVALISGKRIIMHRFINKTPDGMETDHVNGNGLDNRKSNLRSCTTKQNQWNAKKQSNNTSGYKGVSWDKVKSKWDARIVVDGKQFFIGRFDSAEEASKAYNEKSKELCGEFARINAEVMS